MIFSRIFSSWGRFRLGPEGFRYTPLSLSIGFLKVPRYHEGNSPQREQRVNAMQWIEAIKELRQILENQAVIALLAALLGGLFTRKATLNAHKLNARHAQKESLTKARNAISLISVELKEAWHICKLEYVTDLMKLPTGAPYLCTWEIGQNPFIVYDSMPECLTEISPETSAKVVQTYMRVKGLVAMVESNNKNFERVKESGRRKLDSIISETITNQFDITKIDAQDHQDNYDLYIYWEAKKSEWANMQKH